MIFIERHSFNTLSW